MDTSVRLNFFPLVITVLMIGAVACIGVGFKASKARPGGYNSSLEVSKHVQASESSEQSQTTITETVTNTPARTEVTFESTKLDQKPVDQVTAPAKVEVKIVSNSNSSLAGNSNSSSQTVVHSSSSTSSFSHSQTSVQTSGDHVSISQ